METVAILVDGGFYLKRARRLGKDESAEAAAETLYQYCIAHLSQAEGDEHVNDRLYRIFYYDCPPLEQSVFDPLQGKAISLRKTPQYTWMTMFQDELRSKRKMALRFGKLASDGAIQKTLTYDAVKRLVNGTLKREELTDADFFLNIKQKGVDMRIGLDIASMAFKKQVTRMILISGDSDFVPAAKLARREGIDFLLDPMGANINDDLNEHIDGKSTPKFLWVKNKE